MSSQKIAGVIVLLLGVLFIFIAPDRELLALVVCIGLQMIFFAKERIDDERVRQLKMKALFAAMSIGMGATALANHYLFVILQGTLDSVPPKMSACEMLAGILLLALGLYHYWHWQDGKGSVAA
jgi:drug/metabolite transporter (DMT)-like permease